MIVCLSMVGAAAFTGSVAAHANEGPDEEILPGERLSGVVGVVEAELDGELAERSFGITIAQAASEDAKAGAVATQLAEVEDRLDELEERNASLESKLEHGEISEGTYYAGMATVAVERGMAERLVNSSAGVAGGLPVELLEANGINATAIQTLMDRAHELSGPEVAAIAQSIAGPETTDPVGPDPSS